MKGIEIYSKQLHQLLDEKGFAVIPAFISPEQIQSLNAFFHSTVQESKVDSDFFTTHWSSEHAYRSKVNKFVQQLLRPALERHFNNFKCIFGYFLYKKPGVNSKVHMHQDWTMIDEEKSTGFIIWIPLVDTSFENGCFQALPGSHKIFNEIRGSHISPQYENINEQEFVSVQLKAGDAIVFSQNLLHSSPPNHSAEDRLAAGLIIVPDEAEVIHYYYNEKDRSVHRYVAGDQFLVNTFYDYKHRLGNDYILSLLRKHD